MKSVVVSEKTQHTSSALAVVSLVISLISLVFCIFLYGKITTQNTISKRSYLKNRGRVEKLEREVIFLNSHYKSNFLKEGVKQ